VHWTCASLIVVSSRDHGESPGLTIDPYQFLLTIADKADVRIMLPAKEKKSRDALRVRESGGSARVFQWNELIYLHKDTQCPIQQLAYHRY